MGSKGNNRHVKRLASSRYIRIGRKVHAYVIKPNAGRHTAESSISLATIIKEKLNFADSTKEVRSILQAGSVEVNGKVVKDTRYPLGFGDIIHFKPSKESYSIGVASKGAISIEKIEKERSTPIKVIGKYIARGNKEMIRLYNGDTIPSAKGVKVNDSVTIKAGKVHEILKFEKGAKCLVIKGVHASESGTISDIKAGTALRSATIEIDSDKGKTETLLDNVMVVGAK